MDNDPTITIRFSDDDSGSGPASGVPGPKKAAWPPPSGTRNNSPEPYGPPPPPPKAPFAGPNIWGGVGAYPYGPPQAYGPPAPFYPGANQQGGIGTVPYGPHPMYGPPAPLFPGANAFGGAGSVPYGPPVPAGHVRPQPWQILAQTPNAAGGMGAVPYGPERAPVFPQGAYGPVPLPSKDKLGSVIARMAMYEQEAPETSWADSGSKDTLRQAVEMSKSMPTLTPEAAARAERGEPDETGPEAEQAPGKPRWPIVGRLGQTMQTIGNVMRNNYWMMPRGMEMMTLRAGAWMSNIGGGLAGGALGGAALGIGGAAAAVGGMVLAANMASRSLSQITTEGLIPFGKSILKMGSIVGGVGGIVAGVIGKRIFQHGQELSDRFEREGATYKDYSGSVAAAFGQRDFVEKSGLIHRAQMLGPQLADQIQNRTFLNEAASNLEGAGVKMLLDRFGPMLERAMLTLEGLLGYAEKGVLFVNEVFNIVQKELAPVFPLIHAFLEGFIPFFGPISKFLGDAAEAAARDRQKLAQAGGGINLQTLFGDWDKPAAGGPPLRDPAIAAPEPVAPAAAQAFVNSVTNNVSGFWKGFTGNPFDNARLLIDAALE